VLSEHGNTPFFGNIAAFVGAHVVGIERSF
jgi:hypothetical protein